MPLINIKSETYDSLLALRHSEDELPEVTIRRLCTRALAEMQPDPDVRDGGKHSGDPWCDPSAR